MRERAIGAGGGARQCVCSHLEERLFWLFAGLSLDLIERDERLELDLRVGDCGCEAIKKYLPHSIKKNKIDFVVVNGENAAKEGIGIT